MLFHLMVLISQFSKSSANTIVIGRFNNNYKHLNWRRQINKTHVELFTFNLPWQFFSKWIFIDTRNLYTIFISLIHQKADVQFYVLPSWGILLCSGVIVTFPTRFALADGGGGGFIGHLCKFDTRDAFVHTYFVLSTNNN